MGGDDIKVAPSSPSPSTSFSPSPSPSTSSSPSPSTASLSKAHPPLQRVESEKLKQWIEDVFRAAGGDSASSQAVADGLWHGSIRGVDSHGVRLLPHYVKNLEQGGVNARPKITWEAKFPSFLIVDADNGVGQLAGFRAIDLCIQVAKTQGVAVAGVINSHHPGIMASYTLRAARQGYLAFAFTNTGPKILSFGGQRPYFGTNPISFACPREESTPFCLDMATSVIPWNKVEACRTAANQAKTRDVTSPPSSSLSLLPPDCAADGEGNPTTDPHKAESLLPTGGYKGFGLAAMVEILCTALLGLAFGYHTAQMYGPTSDLTKPRRIGQFYMVARCDACVDIAQFKQAMQMMTDEVRSEPPKKGNEADGVMLAGDPEDRETLKRLKFGIPLDDAIYRELVELGRRYSIPFPTPLPTVVGPHGDNKNTKSNTNHIKANL